MAYLYEWLILMSVFGLGLISPGPDFVMAVRNSVTYSRKAGLFTALGFACGVCIHVIYAIVGVSVLISQSAFLFTAVKYIGGFYLFYIGVKAIRSKGYQRIVDVNSDIAGREMSVRDALLSGFITNLFNPKALLFFPALFTQVLSPDLPVSVQALFGVSCVLMTWGWFSLVAVFLTNQRFQAVFMGFSQWIDRICGGLMIGLGVKLVLSK